VATTPTPTPTAAQLVATSKRAAIDVEIAQTKTDYQANFEALQKAKADAVKDDAAVVTKIDAVVATLATTKTLLGKHVAVIDDKIKKLTADNVAKLAKLNTQKAAIK